MDNVENHYRNQYSKIIRDTKRDIVDTRYYNSGTKIGLKKRSGRRVGNDVIKYSISYPTHVCVIDDGQKRWIDIGTESGYKYMIKQYDYSDYKAKKDQENTDAIGVLFVALVAFFLIFIFLFGN